MAWPSTFQLLLLGGVLAFQAALPGADLQLAMPMSVAKEPAAAPGTPLVEVTLLPDEPHIMLGMPTYLTFAVRNLTTEPLTILVGGDYQNALGRPDTFQVMVTREDGLPVPQPDAGENMGGIGWGPVIPALGSYEFRLFLPHWATFSAPGIYRISARRTLELYRGEVMDDDPLREKLLTTQAAETKITVDPADAVLIGRQIEALGTRMLHAQSEAAELAARSLESVQDIRTVPFWIKAAQSGEYELQFHAYSALGGYPVEEAFQALCVAMESPPVPSLMEAASVALSKSSYPAARPYLLSRRKTSSVGVRLTVLHVLGKMPAAEAVPLLREMAQTKERVVREEAQRYLQEMGAAEH